MILPAALAALLIFKVPAPGADGLFCIQQSSSFSFFTHIASAHAAEGGVSASLHCWGAICRPPPVAPPPPFALTHSPTITDSFSTQVTTAGRSLDQFYVSQQLGKSRWSTREHILNVTHDLNNVRTVLTDTQAKKAWVWLDNDPTTCQLTTQFVGPAVGECLVPDSTKVTKLQAGFVGPYPAQWWGLTDANATLVSSTSANLTSLAQLVRFNEVRKDEYVDFFWDRDVEDFVAAPQPASLFALPTECPK